MANKKAKNKKTNENIVSTNELTNLIKIIVIVCVVLLAFYFITVFVNKKAKTNTNNNEDTVAIIQYDKIMVGEILNRPQTEYYVLVKNSDDINSNLYQSYLSIYSGKENALKVYNVDLDDVFNKSYAGQETILDLGISNFKFSEATLLKINNGELEQFITGTEAIENYLKELIK